MSTSRSTREYTPDPPFEVGEPVSDTPNNFEKFSGSFHHSVLTGSGNFNEVPEEKPSRQEKREQVESRLAKEVIKDTMKDITSLIDDVVDDVFLSDRGAPLPDDVVNIDELRDDSGWRKWPKVDTKISEPAMEAFIKLISDTVKDKSLSSLNPREWSSTFYNRPISDPRFGTLYRPDLVLFSHLLSEVEKGNITWKDIVAVMEIKSTEEQQSEADKQVSRYAQCIFNAQPGRRFVIAVTVVQTTVTLWVFDRSGAISCEPFDIHSEPEKFLRIILGTLYLDPEQMGYDSTIYRKGGDDLFITLGSFEYKVKCIYHEPGIRGRGTICYRGVNLSNGSVVVIKDSWVDVAREETEIMTLQRLEKMGEEHLRTPDGVRVIPKLVDHEEVKARRVVDGKIVACKDTTAVFRHDRVEFDGNKPKWAWTKDERDQAKKIEIRRHYRVVMSPFGSTLENFVSLKGLMRAFGDIVHAVRILYDAGILHRDISFRNILLHEHEGCLRGLLIDYDYAISIDRLSSEAVGDRTGTLPFMAIDRLQTMPSSPHRYFHDLESLFYVLCWMSTLYAGPRGTKRPFFKLTFPYRNTKVAVWNGDCKGENTMTAICNSKTVHASIPRGLMNTIKEFSEYFQRIGDCLLDLRVLLYDSEITGNKDEKNKKKARVELEAEWLGCEVSRRKEIIKRFSSIPIYMRPSEVVFESFVHAFEAAENELQFEEAPLVNNTEEDVEYQTAGARRIRDFENISPGIAEDIEPGDDTNNVQDANSEDGVRKRLFFGPSVSRLSNQSMPNKRKSTDVPDDERTSPKRSKTFKRPVASQTSGPRLRTKGSRTPTARRSNNKGSFAAPANPRSRPSGSQVDDVFTEGSSRDGNR